MTTDRHDDANGHLQRASSSASRGGVALEMTNPRGDCRESRSRVMELKQSPKTAMPTDATRPRAPISLLQGHTPCIQSGCVSMLKPISPRIMSTITAVMIHIMRISDFSFC